MGGSQIILCLEFLACLFGGSSELSAPDELLASESVSAATELLSVMACSEDTGDDLESLL